MGFNISHVPTVRSSQVVLRAFISASDGEICASVVESHHLSDHRLIVCDLWNVRVKQPPPIRLTRRLKRNGKTDFEHRLCPSTLRTDAATTIDTSTIQLEEVASNMLDTVAPLRAIFAACHLKLSERERRVFERQWKRTKKNTDSSSIVKRVGKPINSSMYPDTKNSTGRLNNAPTTLDRNRMPSRSSYIHHQVLHRQHGFAIIATYFSDQIEVNKPPSLFDSTKFDTRHAFTDSLISNRIHSHSIFYYKQ